MKITNIFCGAITLIGFLNNAQARVITVNNRLDVVADYTSLQAAYDNASEGDTIMAYPSETAYAGIDISKRLILIGNGFVSVNNLPITMISGIVNFLEGSEGSVIESFGGRFNVTVKNANNILISRNNINGLVIENSFNTLLLSNLINGSYTTDGYMIVVKGNSLVEASNDIIRSTGQPCGYSSTCYDGGILIEGSSVIKINNSIIYSEGQLTIYGGIAQGKNNIIYGGLRSSVDFSFSIHSNAWEGQLDVNKNNIIASDISSIFTDLSTYNYHLKSGSSAIGTGENGIDMGIYGSATPFVDGGTPDIPAIYYLDVPLTGSQKDGINVTVKAKSNQ